MKKRIALLALLLLFCAGLAGCEKNSQPGQDGSSDVLLPPPQEEQQDPEPGTPPEEDDEEEEEPQPVYPQIKLLVQEYGEKNGADTVVEIPVFSVGGKQEELDAFNRQMQDMANEYAQFKESESYAGGAWADIKAYPRTGERYVQVVVKKIYYPTYGTQGELFGMCFDVEEQKAVTMEEVFTRFGLSEAGLRQRFLETVGEPCEGDQLDKIEYSAFLLEEENAAVYCRVFYKNQQASDRDELYCYSTETNAFTPLRDEALADPDTLDDFDTPLSYDQETATPESYGITDHYMEAKELLMQYVQEEMEGQLAEGQTLTFMNNGTLIVDGVSCYMINLGAATETSYTPLGSFAVAEDLSCLYEVDPMTGEFTKRLDR